MRRPLLALSLALATLAASPAADLPAEVESHSLARVAVAFYQEGRHLGTARLETNERASLRLRLTDGAPVEVRVRQLAGDPYILPPVDVTVGSRLIVVIGVRPRLSTAYPAR